MKNLRRTALLLCLGLFTLTGPSLHAAGISLEGPETSDTGHFQLSWDSDDTDMVNFRLEQAAKEDFSDARVLYEGSDHASSMSGYLDGTYYFRVCDESGTRCSETLTVTVQHHSLGQALVYLALGAAVFISTLVLIVGGHRRHRREYPGNG